MKNLIGQSLSVLLLAALLSGCGDGQQAQAEGTESPVAAYIGDDTITTAELEEQAAGELADLDQKRYELLRQTLEQMVDERLIRSAAAGAGLQPNDLMQAEVEDKVVPPTEEEIAAFYEQNKARLRGNPAFEDVRPQIVGYIEGQQRQSLRSAFVANLKRTADYRVVLDAPRTEIELADNVPSRGPADAPITMVEFGDFECPFCRRAHPAVEQLLLKYGDEIRYVFRDYPLPNHSRATPASVAAYCAGDQGQFWSFYENLMVIEGDLSDGDLVQRAANLGLDAEQFNACYTSRRYENDVLEAMKQGRALGVTGTPTFFINGRKLVGAVSYDQLRTVVEEELNRADSGA
jgi:protein-disulfide isomerase